MRILLVITRSCLGGAQSVLMNIANTLCNEHSVAVAAGIDDGEEASLLWQSLDPAVRTYRVEPLVKRLNPIKDFKAAIELRKIYKDFQPDVIHLHSSKIGVLGRIVFPPRKIIYTVHGFDSIRIANRKYLPIEKALQKRCRFIVGVSQYDCDNLKNEGISNHVELVYNGLNIKIEEGLIPPKGFSKDKKNIVCIARLSPQKNHILFVEIAKQLREYNFIWIGNLGPVDIPVTENCHFIGNLMNAGAYCKFAQLFLLTSNYEGLPMTIIEAMSQGLPIVSSDVGGIKEIVKNGENGFAVPNQAEIFVEKICYILENESVYSKMSKESQAIYTGYLTVDKMVSSYYNLYCKIANITN